MLKLLAVMLIQYLFPQENTCVVLKKADSAPATADKYPSPCTAAHNLPQAISMIGKTLQTLLAAEIKDQMKHVHCLS